MRGGGRPVSTSGGGPTPGGNPVIRRFVGGQCGQLGLRSRRAAGSGREAYGAGEAFNGHPQPM